MIQFILQTQVISQLQFIDKVVDVPVCRFSSSSGAVFEKAVEIHSCNAWKHGRLKGPVHRHRARV